MLESNKEEEEACEEGVKEAALVRPPFRVWGLGSRVQGLGLMGWGLGSGVKLWQRTPLMSALGQPPSEKGTPYNAFEDLYLKAKARIWP